MAKKFDAAEIHAWREGMGYSLKHAVTALGCKPAEFMEWESGAREIPRYIDLACQALACGMKAYDDDTEDK